MLLLHDIKLFANSYSNSLNHGTLQNYFFFKTTSLLQKTIEETFHTNSLTNHLLFSWFIYNSIPNVFLFLLRIHFFVCVVKMKTTNSFIWLNQDCECCELCVATTKHIEFCDILYHTTYIRYVKRIKYFR